MAGVTNTLYPPILDTYMPAFIKTEACRIYFTISDYNSVSNIKYIQLAVNNQYTNASMLDAENYPSEIKLIDFSEVKIENNKYYIDLFAKDTVTGKNIITNGQFEINQYYKIQLRFVHNNAPAPQRPDGAAPGAGLESWLVQNQSLFSEWSRVCLIRAIDKPYIDLIGFNNVLTTNFTVAVTDIVGKMYFMTNPDIATETLESYQIIIQSASSEEENNTVYDSGIIYTDSFSPNEINHVIGYQLHDGTLYDLIFTYTTNNGYTETLTYSFTSIQSNIERLDVDVSATPIDVDGSIEIHIKKGVLPYNEPDNKGFFAGECVHPLEKDEMETSVVENHITTVIEEEPENFTGSITIRRSSSETNFQFWEDMHTFTLFDQPIDYKWRDRTVKSGVFYKYCVQKRDIKGNRGEIVPRDGTPALMILLEDIFLTRGDMQLKVKYNPTISSFKYVVGDSKTETLGSQYPFIRRNSKMNYRQFPISGMITSFCDEEGLFLNKQNIYKYNTVVDAYNQTQEFNSLQYNYTYERDFREKVMEFLYENNVKLFRSGTEGNILVRLMDINLTPNATLGRMIYTFTATANEIDECSVSNYDKYGIQPIGEYQTVLETVAVERGYISDTFAKNTNIFTVLNQKYKNDVDTTKYIKTVRSLKWLRIDFESDPYLIGINNNIAVKAVQGVKYDSYILGYLVDINGVRIIVNKKGYYELNDEDTEVTTLSFPEQTTFSMSYIGNMVTAEDPSATATNITFDVKAGQIRGVYDYNTLLMYILKAKYYRRKKEYYQHLLAVNEITFEIDPGTLVEVSYAVIQPNGITGEDKTATYIADATGLLHIFEEDVVITDFAFKGVQLSQVSNERELDARKYGARNYEYILTNQAYSNNIKHPIKNGLYAAGEDYKIFYKDGYWYDADYDSEKGIVIVHCPTEALIDYIYEIIKGEY